MSSSTLLLFFLFTFIHLLVSTLAQLKDCTSGAEYCWKCSDIGNYSANSIYQKNLNSLLLSNFSSIDQNKLGFYNISSGQGSDTINAIGLCMGSLDSAKCQSCLNVTNHMILERCPNQKEAILWGEFCLVRYSNNSIFHVMKEEPLRTLASPNPAADANRFKVILKPLLDDLINKAASDVRKYALGNAKVPNSQPIYALVQCTLDLTQKQCSDCLQDSTLKIPDCCGGKNGARVLKPSCTLRYESGPFYDTTGPQQSGVCTQTADYCWNCIDAENDTSMNTFNGNVKTLLSSLSSDKTGSVYGFFNSSFGTNPNRVSAIALCRGDVSPETCLSCVSNSSQRLLERCTKRREGILWDQLCMVRYSNKTIFYTRQDDARMYVLSPNEAWEPNLFKLTLKPLLDNITSKASSGDSLQKYASGQSTVPGYETIYAAVQCTPDLNKDECSGCLDEAILYIPQQFGGKQGARVLKSSCNLRYEVNLFYQPTANKQPAVMPNSPKVKKNNTSRTVTIVVVPSVVAVLVLIFCIRFFIRRMKITQENLHNPEDITSETGLQFNFNIIKDATNDFSEKNKLGQGGFGAVYKGRLLDGKEIAVKRPLRVPSSPGHGDQEFKNEVRLVAKLSHRNLVSLQGFCLEKNERILVYEFMPNNSLDRFIFDPVKREHLDWGIRYRIIKGIARGLLYLHEESGLKIIHRDLKASNILLDAQMNPKISDFGTARLFILDQSLQNTKKIVGTRGYMAPEYAKCGQVSVKSDVFSFGVLVLEIVSGQEVKNFKNFHEGEEVESLLSYAWIIWKEGNASNLADPIMRGVLRQEMLICIHIGLLCVQEKVADRPTMRSVFVMLNSSSHSLEPPSRPAYFIKPKCESSEINSNSVMNSENNVSMTELYPR